MRFYKLSGAGNDFIILDGIRETLPEEHFPDMARTLCQRRMSLGADGLMVVQPSDKADFRMAFYNSDGSVGEMCGNGARCICRYGYETGLSGETQTVETVSGVVTGQRIDRRYYRVRLTEPSVVCTDFPIEVDGRHLDCAYVELGNPGLPHAVVPMPGLRECDENALFELGQKIRRHPAFPKGANVNFYDFIGKNHIYERTFERGVEGFTYACGTGTASVALILTLRGEVRGENFRADMRGGRLFVDVEREGQSVTGLYLIGPTNIVAVGEILDEELNIK